MLTIGNRIKELRLKKEYTQPQLAKYMNVSKQTVSNWEKENRIPDANTLKKLSCFFDVSVDYLLGIVDDPNHIRVSGDKLPEELRDIGIEYLTLAKEMQDKEIPPEDVKKILDILKKHT